MDVSKVTRVDIIDHRAEFAPYRKDYLGVTPELVLQDDGRTLKVILTDHPTVAPAEVSADMAASMAAEMEAIREAHRSVVRRRLVE